MTDKSLRNEGNALRIQKDQLTRGIDKLSEVDQILSVIQKEQEEEDFLLDNMLDAMESMCDNNPQILSPDEGSFNENWEQLGPKLYNIDDCPSEVKLVSEVDNIILDENNDNWDDYLKKLEDYARKHEINLEEDPFKHLMTKQQQIELQKRINEEFTFQNVNCDKYDYLIAVTCGFIGGLIDILFVMIPGISKLGSITDEVVNKLTETFASFLGWDRNRVIERGGNTTASAIAFLERKFQVNYDQATTPETKGAVKNLSIKNHHLKNWAHSPDLIGLIFSIVNQLTSTSTFINEGKIITINTNPFELQGTNLISKIFCGFANWFGHIISDWAGSSGSAGQGHRGTGVPIPFYNLFQLMNFGRFGEKHRETFATITSKVFEQGYDLRYGMTMCIPVIITELLIRFMYTMKAHFYHKKDWQESLPQSNIPELRRMLLVGHGTLCMCDGIDAFIRSGGEIVSFLLRTNLVAWVKFGSLALREIIVWYRAGHVNCNAVDRYLEKEYRKMLKGCYS